MPRLDIVKTAFAGFGIIGRNPLAVLVWAVFLGLVGVLPAVGLMGGFVSTIGQIVAISERGGEPTPEMIMPMIGSVIAMVPVLLLTGLVVRMVLTGAVFRAILFPGEKSWFYLRLGARELWLGLLFIVVGIVGFALSMIMMGLIAPLVLVAASNDDPLVTMMMVRLGMLPVYGVMIFLFVRFCLAFPMTFAESKFRLIESWKMTSGNGWRILLVGLMLFALLIVAEMILILLVVIAAVAVVGAGAVSGGWSEERLTAFFNQDPTVWMHALLPWIAGAAVVGSLLATLVAVIFTAPWAEAYRQLRGSPEATV